MLSSLGPVGFGEGAVEQVAAALEELKMDTVDGGTEAQSDQDVGWETYWCKYNRRSEHTLVRVSSSCYHNVSSNVPVSVEARQGEALLWSRWLETHPETRSEDGAPWDNADTKAAWDEHAADTCYYYWEQYSYWVGQGWTTEGEETLACDGRTEAHSREWTADRQKTDRQCLDELLGRTCSEDEPGGHVSPEAPADGGQTCKRPAASSHTNGTQPRGNVPANLSLKMRSKVDD